MCGRYYFDDGRDSVELRGIIDEVNRRAAGQPVKTSGEIFPSDIVPVMAGADRAPAALAMRWGFALPDGRLVFNARSETAGEKPMFREGMLRRRCAVPATTYFEWERAGGKRTKYAIRPRQDGLFYMAGVYRLEDGVPAFSILTRDPAADIAFIHNRMPVILPRDIVEDWIDPRFDSRELLKHAVLSVRWERTEDAEQLRMQF